ncbi:hypothetical protein [Candidatus Uabimicrobium sp. HlEnr_7]|uniref:hypothetical protein n=1 Tax=Candidatus Uabimicrobium helgolandensis TaxID=3095367 RepID=UPI0035566D7E
MKEIAMPFFRLIIWLLILTPFGFCQKQYLYIKEIQIHKLKQNGKHWDSFKGSPDVVCNIFTLQDGIWKKTFTSKGFNNTLKIDSEMDTQIEVSVNFQIKIEIVDLDLGDHDTIGKLDITMREEDFGNGLREISFDRIGKFIYFFSPYQTKKEKIFAEKVNEVANKKLEVYQKSVAKDIDSYKKTIVEQKKIILENKNRIDEYTKIIEHLTEKIQKLQKDKEDEAWDNFDEDLKEDLKDDDLLDENLKDDN